MRSELARFEVVAREAHKFTEAAPAQASSWHPFDERNIHADLPSEVRRLFDNAHYSQATFEAFKFLDEEVQRISGEIDFGRSLMMSVFGGTHPKLKLNPGMTSSEQNEQEGFKFLFAGAVQAI